MRGPSVVMNYYNLFLVSFIRDLTIFLKKFRDAVMSETHFRPKV